MIKIITGIINANILIFIQYFINIIQILAYKHNTRVIIIAFKMLNNKKYLILTDAYLFL